MPDKLSCEYCHRKFSDFPALRVHLTKKTNCGEALRKQVEHTGKEKARRRSDSLPEPPAALSPSPSDAGLPPSPPQPDFQPEWLQDDTRDVTPMPQPRPNPAFKGPLTDDQEVDVLEVGFDAMFIEPFPEAAGRTYGQEETAFETRMRAARQKGSEDKVDWEKARWSPFAHQGEWELAEWMSKRLGKNEVEEFLRLSIVSLHLCVMAGSLSVVRSRRSTCHFGAPTCLGR
jgi:hypothetical protein